jgi:hypothetical protein
VESTQTLVVQPVKTRESIPRSRKGRVQLGLEEAADAAEEICPGRGKQTLEMEPDGREGRTLVKETWGTEILPELAPEDFRRDRPADRS